MSISISKMGLSALKRNMDIPILSLPDMIAELRAFGVLVQADADEGSAGLWLNMNSTFSYCADVERIEEADIPEIWLLWRRYAWVGPVWWVWQRRGIPPMPEVQKNVLAKIPQQEHGYLLRSLADRAYQEIPPALRGRADKANLKGHYDEEWPRPLPPEVTRFLYWRTKWEDAERALAAKRAPDLTLRRVKRVELPNRRKGEKR